MSKITIALDAMGGDHGPGVVVPAALQVLKENKDLKIILVGQREAIQEQLLKKNASEGENLVIKHASQSVAMDESPSQALRGKKDSSMRVAINLVKEGEAAACVSAGNTGALMATARFVLKTLPGIDRPAIISRIPTKKPNFAVRVLDLGANVDSSAEHLFQFAVMGSVLASAVNNIEKPRIGLLNIGAEEMKGNEQVKKTAQLLSKAKNLNYVGFLEGDAVYDGDVDVVVCDGFVGNVALKTSEGVSKLISGYIKQECKENLLAKLSSLAAFYLLKRVAKRIDPAQYNGATLIGLNGIVIKSHGSADAKSYENAIREAILEVDHNVPQRIKEQVGQLLQKEQGE